MLKCKRIFCMLMVLAVASLGSFAALAETSDEFLGELTGTYEELFPVMCDPAYDQIWLDNCAKAVGEDAAQEAADMLRAACVGEVYGQEAIDAYAGDPDSAQFDCYFINGVSEITIEGNTISGVDADGQAVFSHTYTYLGNDNAFSFYTYQSDDADAGEFTYFLFAPDTPESTYHIEFRYGSDLDALTQDFYSGPYAYWLAAGIPTEYDDALLENVIALFCAENLAETEEQAS